MNQRGGTPPLKICPKCGRKSVFWNSSTSLYDCLNRDCQKRFTNDEMAASPIAPVPPVGRSHIHLKRRSWVQVMSSKTRWAWRRCRHLPLKKWLLILLLVAGLAVAGYTGHLLVAKQIGTIPAWVIIGVDAAFLIWSISLLRHRWKPSSASVFGIFIAIALLASTACAYGGVTPFSGVKQSIVDRLTETSTSVGADAKVTGIYADWDGMTYGSCLVVNLVPTSLTTVDGIYIVKLFEKGKLRDTGILTWSQPELNIRATHQMEFPLTANEYQVYYRPLGYTSDLSKVGTGDVDSGGVVETDLRNIFSVTVETE